MEPNSSNFRLTLRIWREILSYLPVKSLLQFRSVSKAWKSIIDNPDFASLHLTHYPNNCLESHLIVLEKPNVGGKARARSYSRGTYKAEYNPQTSEFDIPIPPCIATDCFSDFRWEMIRGDVHGLLLVLVDIDIEGEAGTNEIFLWNPSIRKTINIPLPPSRLRMSEIMFLGYDPSTNDYKVVHIYGPDTLDIFSLLSRSWRRGNFSAAGGKQSLIYSVGHRNVSSGGSSVHSIVCAFFDYSNKLNYEQPNYELATFNTTSETFSYILLPKFDRRKFGEPVLMTGSTVGFVVKCDDCVEIWVLNDDCSWSRSYRLGISPLGFETCFLDENYSLTSSYFTKDGAFIWGYSDKEGHYSVICSYETSTGIKGVVTDSTHWFLFYTGAYMESLILLAEDN